MNTNKPFPTTEAELRKVIAETVAATMTRFVIVAAVTVGVIEWLLSLAK